MSAEKVKENLFSFVEVTVLKSLSDAQATECATIEVSELSSVTGIKDNDEVPVSYTHLTLPTKA